METDILFIQPSFARGAARIIDLWGSLDDYNLSYSGEEADELATKADFAAIAEDSRKALAVLKLEMKAKQGQGS